VQTRAKSRVVIGIPSFRRPDGVRNLLRSIAGQEDIGDLAIEIFVADSDPLRREARAVCEDQAAYFRWPLRCEVVEDAGVSAARNRILADARAREADFVAMLDDDEVADARWLSELVAMQERTGADAVGGLVRYDLPADVPASVLRYGYFNRPRWPPGSVPLLLGAGNVLICCHSLERVGWPSFDARFGASGGEDAEYFIRLRSIGFRYAWAPAAIATEQVSGDRLRETAIVSRAWRTGNNEVRIYQANRRAGALAVTIAKAAAMLLASSLLAPMLLIPSRRLWLRSKWASSTGMIAALFGRSASYYGRK
jgi:succinoglycan biosynthesis protein ExoM